MKLAIFRTSVVRTSAIDFEVLYLGGRMSAILLVGDEYNGGVVGSGWCACKCTCTCSCSMTA
jgi:hypothetical protein